MQVARKAEIERARLEQERVGHVINIPAILMIAMCQWRALVEWISFVVMMLTIMCS